MSGYCMSQSMWISPNNLRGRKKKKILLTTAFKQPKIAPKISILPILTLTGSAARCCPSGVRTGWASSQAPIFRSKFIALLITWTWGGSNALERNSSGEPRSHFCLNEIKKTGADMNKTGHSHRNYYYSTLHRLLHTSITYATCSHSPQSYCSACTVVHAPLILKLLKIFNARF